MKENQNIEWKQSWRDEYLKWLCGFANAEGGVMVIGRNDKGVAVGVKDATDQGGAVGGPEVISLGQPGRAKRVG